MGCPNFCNKKAMYNKLFCLLYMAIVPKLRIFPRNHFEGGL
nr:MAG TPA: hypothetical protein [Caudoviricetes sp.]